MPEINTEMPALLDAYGEFAVLSLIILAVVGLIFSVRDQRRSLDSTLQRLEDLHREVSSYGQSLIGMRTVIGNMEARINDFTERNLEIQSQFAFNRSFEEASRLIREGGTVESLVSDCGLSDAEASLMMRLHRTDAEKPRQQWKQLPVRESFPLSGSESDLATDGASEPKLGSPEALVGEEIRLRETLRSAAGRS